MSIYHEKLWKYLKRKIQQEDEVHDEDQCISSQYETAIREICDYAVNRAKLIRDTFPMYTLHDEKHIINVMRIMVNLLGEKIDKLTRDEAAMLFLAACCHDIGMSYSENERDEVLKYRDRFEIYLINHPKEYVKVYAKGMDQPEISDEIIRGYLRSIHHERVGELLTKSDWPQVLNGLVDVGDLIRVCQSHGNDISSLDQMNPTNTVDLRFCAVILRLADILDFDTSRAPQAVYEYCGFEGKSDSESLISKEEWDKHRSSLRFDFDHLGDRSVPYNLPYSANCNSMQVEQAINSYLDWVDKELYHCIAELRRYAGKWNKFVLPAKVDRHIVANGYVSGQYSLSLDQSQVLKLLVGDNLYADPSVFVRELIQNAIDAVRTRERMDKNRPQNWRPQINIRTWMDKEGYYWFRIEDNGTGMTEDIIRKYLLKVGNSYYTSDQFKQDKIRYGVDESYTPISRFGIGILSCFMGNSMQNHVEISTKRFRSGDDYPWPLRLRMHGLNGYYALYTMKDASHHPGPMKGQTQQEKDEYLSMPGTVVAVRTNLYQDGRYKGFREIVDKYVVYPPVPIHYDGPEGAKDYMTDAAFMEQIHNVNPSEDLEQEGVLTFELNKEQLQMIMDDYPELTIIEPPAIHLKFVALDHYTDSPNLYGAMVVAKTAGNIKESVITFGSRQFTMEAGLSWDIDTGYENVLTIRINIDLKPIKSEESAFEDFKYQSKKLYKSVEFNELRNLARLELEKKRLKSVQNGDIDDLEYSELDIEDIEEYIKYAILQGFLFDDFYDYEFLSHAFPYYGTVNRHLNEKIIKVLSDLGMDSQFISALIDSQALKGRKTSWKFSVCNLYKLSWYKSLFRTKTISEGRDDLVAHNGILCGATDNNTNKLAYYHYNLPKKGNLGTILLLQDSYKPELGIERDGIRQLPLETLIDFELICRKLRKSGYEIDDRFKGIRDTEYYDFSSLKYLNILEQRPDLTKQIDIPTNEGDLSAEQIIRLVKEDKKVIDLNGVKNLLQRMNNDYNSNLYLGYLQKEGVLCAHIKKSKMTIQARNIKPPLSGCRSHAFPAGFFLPFDKEDEGVLTNKSSFYRLACNSNHRLSQFLIENAEFLQEHTAGVFRELMKTLSNADGRDFINRINGLLSLLRELPSTTVSIPDTLFLTMDDLG